MNESHSKGFNSIAISPGGYRDALTFRPGEPISFNPDAFIQSRSPAWQAFLAELMSLQTFEQFRCDRLEMLNCGEGFQVQFSILMRFRLFWIIDRKKLGL